MSRALVAYGGRSLEREVSARSGQQAAKALKQLGHAVELVDVGADFVDVVQRAEPDFVFIALHGVGGEDGTVQDLLEILQVPYTGSDALASAICLDKHTFKSLCELRDVPTPSWHSFTKQAFADYGAGKTLDALWQQFDGMMVVKPARQGSSFGLSVVQERSQLGGAVLGAMSYDDRVLLERFVPGRELAVTVLGPADAPEPLPVVEIVMASEEYYSFQAHYEIGQSEVRLAGLPPDLDRRVRQVAADAYRAAGCRDFARVDIRLEDEQPWVLEINTIPGLTETGPTPLAAEHAGLTFAQLIERISARVVGG
jgi:D-alanine-D-alanine ligase